MARKSRMTILKRQREVKKAQKQAEKRAKRQGLEVQGSVEPRPTIEISSLFGRRPAESDKSGQ